MRGLASLLAWAARSLCVQEMLIHVILATGATELLWWKPGHMRPYDVGVALLAATLAELEGLLNDDHEGVGMGVFSDSDREGDGNDKDLPMDGHELTPLVVDEFMEISDWSEPYVLSGARVVGSGRTLLRFTPRCLQDGTPATAQCVKRPSQTVNGTSAVYKIGSGFALRLNGTLVVPERNTSAPLGFWIVR